MEEEKQQEKKDEKVQSGIPVIRTYKSDSAEYIKEGKVSKVDIISAQAKKGFSVKSKPKKGNAFKNILIAFFVFLAIAGAGIAGFWYLNKGGEEALPVSLPKPVIAAEEEMEITNPSQTKGALNGFLKANNLRYIPVVEEFGGKKRLLTTKEFFSAMEISPPFAPADAFSSGFMLASFGAEDSYNLPLIIISVRSYEHAFASMLKWEKATMYTDMTKIFGAGKDLPEEAGFIDKEIQNRDVRVLYGANGETALAYSFINDNYLVISSSEEALKEIFRRFSLPQYLN